MSADTPTAAWKDAGTRKPRTHGNSTVLTLPQAARDAAGIQAGDEVRLFARDGALVVTPQDADPVDPEAVEDVSWAATIAARAEYVDWLTPIQQADWIACRVAGLSYQEQADRRGVEQPAVENAVEGADERLAEVHAERERLADETDADA